MPYNPLKLIINPGKGYKGQALLVCGYKPTLMFEIVTKFHVHYNPPQDFKGL